MRIILKHLAATILIWAAALQATGFAQDAKLAVINTRGDVWARDLDLVGGTVGGGMKLSGPGLFGGPDDQFVVASLNSIAVINTAGGFWPRTVTSSSVGPGIGFSGTLFGGPDAKYVLDFRSCNQVYVVNDKGDVWSHAINSSSVGGGWRLNGNLFGAPDDKYVVLDEINRRILVVNTRGEVWGHDLSKSDATFCGFDGVGAGYRLNGPGLFGAPDDKYVAVLGNTLMVINTRGEVWTRNMTRSTIGPGVKLNGPGLFGAPDDKYVVAYFVRQPAPPPR